jgi:predicted Zn-dependent peptidase
MTVVVAGGMEEKAALDLVKKYFSDMRKFQTIPFKPVREAQAKPALLLRPKKTEQVHIEIGLRTEGIETPDRYPLSVLAAILGGGMSSRLFEEVREKRGLGYYVRTHSEQYEDCGTISSTAGVDPKRVQEAVEVIVEEYKKVGKGKMEITKEEFAKSKEYLKGHLVLELEDSRAVAGFFAHEELLEKEIKKPHEVLELVDKVTIDDVNKVGQKYFINEGLNLALIGNFDNRQALDSMLSLS